MKPIADRLNKLNQFDFIILKTLCSQQQVMTTDLIKGVAKLHEIYNFKVPHRSYFTHRLDYLTFELGIIVKVRSTNNTYYIKEEYKSEISYLCRAYFDLWGKLRSDKKWRF